MMTNLLEAQTPSLRIFRRIEPLVTLKIETSQYIAKTVDHMEEFEQVLSLRAKIFSEEYGAQLASAKIDIDEYDFKGDHLVIIDKATGDVVGTYRLLSSRFTHRFYSESEFEMREFLDTPGMKLELGRACVAVGHRKGSVLNLLWRAVVQYAFQIKARYLFGCSSVKTVNYHETQAILKELESKNQLSQEWSIKPKSQFEFSPEERSDGGLTQSQLTSVPPLFRSYLKAGAKIVGQPALDRDFRCVDFLTVLKLADLAQSYENRYKTEFDI